MPRKYTVIYCRYSTDMQRADSCADQEWQVRAALARLGVIGLEVVVIYDKAESGTKTARNGFQRLCDMVARLVREFHERFFRLILLARVLTIVPCLRRYVSATVLNRDEVFAGECQVPPLLRQGLFSHRGRSRTRDRGRRHRCGYTGRCAARCSPTEPVP